MKKLSFILVLLSVLFLSCSLEAEHTLETYNSPTETIHIHTF